MKEKRIGYVVQFKEESLDDALESYQILGLPKTKPQLRTEIEHLKESVEGFTVPKRCFEVIIREIK